MMRRFWANEGENKRIPGEIGLEEANLMAEEAIIKDKERFGRTRNSLMKYLRAEYGEEIANRALWRVSRRISEGHLKSGKC